MSSPAGPPDLPDPTPAAAPEVDRCPDLRGHGSCQPPPSLARPLEAGLEPLPVQAGPRQHLQAATARRHTGLRVIGCSGSSSRVLIAYSRRPNCRAFVHAEAPTCRLPSLEPLASMGLLLRSAKDPSSGWSSDGPAPAAAGDETKPLSTLNHTHGLHFRHCCPYCSPPPPAPLDGAEASL